MKKITIIFMLVLMIFASCSMDTSYDDSNEIEEKTNTEKEDDTENNTDEPSNEEDNSENDNDEEGNSEIVVEEPSNEEDNSENEIEDKPSNEENDDVVTEPTENNNDEEGNSEIVVEEPSNEDDSENGDVENKTWCEIGEDIKILGLNYFVCVDNSQTKLSPSINDESQAKKDTFLIRDYADCALKYIEIRVKYDNGKLNFSSVNDTYTIVDVTMEDSNVNITIEWK